MNKIQVSLFEVHPVTREKIAEHVTVIETDEYGPSDLPDFFRDNLADIRSQAAKAVASRSVDYDSFGSDSAYLDRIDQVAETLYLSDVCIPNAVVRAYDMEGIYPGEGGMWGDVEHGACQGEAEFRALWTMSVNDGFETDAERATPDEAVTSLQGYMEDQELTGMCHPWRPKAEDAEEILKKLAEIARNGSEAELRKAVVEGAADFIGKLHEVVSDEIVLLPEAEADAAPSAAL